MTKSKFVTINHHMQKLWVARDYLQEAHDFITQNGIDDVGNSQIIDEMVENLKEIRNNISSKEL